MKLSIDNYYHYTDKLASGAQPSEAQFADLKEAGFEAIVNLSPVNTHNAMPAEAAVVDNTGMAYVHFPVDCSNLQAHHYSTFEGIMNGMRDKKIFVHCGGNIKSSCLIHMYHVLANGMDEAESLGTLLKIHQPEEKWYDYFRLMGMQGVR